MVLLGLIDFRVRDRSQFFLAWCVRLLWAVSLSSEIFLLLSFSMGVGQGIKGRGMKARASYFIFRDGRGIFLFFGYDGRKKEVRLYSMGPDGGWVVGWVGLLLDPGW